MTNTHYISRTTVGYTILIWWGIFAALLFSGFDGFYLLPIVSFSFLVLVPGFLTMLVLKIKNISLWPYIVMVVGWSVLEIMLVGLVGNLFLSGMGVLRPLTPFALFVELSGLVLILWSIAFTQRETISFCLKIRSSSEKRRDFILAVLPFIFVVLAVLGAVRLNNGAGGWLTIVMLLGIGANAVFLALRADRQGDLGENVLPTALYFMALALLLMTSLRGWHTTGHDIQVESYVFALTKYSGVWTIETFRNAYNACVSITILPTVFSMLSRLSDPYIYKVLFQIIFAGIAPVAYSIVRRYTSMSIAFLSAFYFIAFPTFFSDMPMLNRQEMAFIFWSLMVFLLFETNISVTLRRAMFIFFGVGVILSHYSTTYTVIALLIGMIAVRPVAEWVIGLFKDGSFFRSSGMVPEKPFLRVKEETVATKWVVTILVLLTFMWNSVLTDTSSGSITRVVARTFEAMRSATKEDTRSSDVFYGLFSWKHMDKETILKEYEKKIVIPMRAKASPEMFYPDEAYLKYPIIAVLNPDGAPTVFGSITERVLGLDPSQSHYFLRQIFAKLIQLLIVIGFVFALLRKSVQEHVFGIEFSLFSVGSLLFVASQVLLPVLSAEYGVFRAFQQSLLFLGVSIVIGSMALFARLSMTKRLVAASLFAVAFFFAMTGVATQMFLQHPPQLHLSNNGLYYDIYYTHESDLRGAQWVDMNIPKDIDAIIQTDRSDFSELRRVSGVTVIPGVYPGIVRTKSYIFLNYENTHNGNSIVMWNGDIVEYNYPLQFLEENKDALYSNGTVVIYR